MRTIIFLGKFFPKNLIRTVLEDSKGKMGMSNHNFEMSIVNGLCAQTDIHLHCITIPGVYSYPYNNRRLYTSREIYKYRDAFIESISFVNFPILKELCSTIGLAIRLIRRIRKYKTEKVDVIVNTPDNRLLRGLSIARVFLKQKISQTVIIPDMPSVLTEMNKDVGSLKYFIIKTLDRSAMRMTAKSDGLVLLTKSMIDFFSCPIKYIVVEGLVDLSSVDMVPNELVSKKEVILYTGSIKKIFGVMNLVEAFKKIDDPNIELWICGSGDAKEEIESAVLYDNRIKFFGMVEAREAIRMQRAASILINPRTSRGVYTKYSFPSKTIEYLLSGKSVIINRLPGIPDEYYDYVYVPENESVDALAEVITKVLNLDKAERNERALKGREFIIENKSSIAQVRRILELIESYQN